MHTFTSYQDCVDPGLEILLKLLKIKKFNTNELISELNKSSTFYEAATKIIKVHDCNMKIMTKILSIIFYIKSDKYLCLLSISKLKNIFLVFRNIGFDLIHEVILYLLKTIIVSRINAYHKSNPIKTLTRNNSMSISSVNSKKVDKPIISSRTSSPNTSLNNSNSSLNNSNSNLKKRNTISPNRSQNDSQSPIRTSKTLAKNNTVSSLNKVFKNGLNDNSPRKSDNENINSLSNDKNKNNNSSLDDSNFKENPNNNSANNISGSNDNNVDYGNQYPFDKIVAEINGGLFSVEDLNDVLSIFTPALNMIKSKVYYTEVQKNNKIFYKFTNCLEIIAFLILTLITSKDNSDKLKFLIFYKIIENLVTIIAINSNKGIYKDIHMYFSNKQYIMINNKICIIRSFYYIFKIIEIIREKFPNLRVII